MLKYVREACYSYCVADDKSRLRQKLLALETERQQHIERVLSERGGLVRGTVGERSRVCGHEGCRCNRGERHVSKYLSAAEGGRTRQVHLPESEVAKVSEGASRYQAFRRARTRVGQLAAEEVKLIDRLGNALLEKYPPDRPIAPAARRGPRPRKTGHDER
jgi:hypothetical protein